jgi:hypothetical protein
MEKYYGNYLGLVVSDDGQDPERRGRIQVWVPGITNTMYGGWNDDPTDKKIYYIGDDSQLKDVDIQRLRAVLPWAECASPLIGGGGTPLYYNKSSGGSVQTSEPAPPPPQNNGEKDIINIDDIPNDPATPSDGSKKPGPPADEVVQYEGYKYTGMVNGYGEHLYEDPKNPQTYLISEDIPSDTKYTVPQK